VTLTELVGTTVTTIGTGWSIGGTTVVATGAAA